MGETIPPASNTQLASGHDDEEDPHESVTIAPPAPNFDEILRQPTPVPSLSHRSDLHFRAALDAGNRAGSSLAELSKMAAELSGGVIGAKRANEQLVQELSTLRAMLGSANEQQLSLRHRVAELEQEIIAVREQATHERQFLTDQHDDFLAALLEEHEEALAAAQSTESDTRRLGPESGDLAQKLVQTETARLELERESMRIREGLAKAQTQRDEAQMRAAARERERDELRAEASMLRARLGTLRSSSTTPPPPVVSRPPSFHPPPALELDSGELDSTLHSRPPAPRPKAPSLPSRRMTPPPELERAVYTPRPVSVTPAPISDTASPFPRVSTRPGVGGPKPSDAAPPADFGPPPSGWTPVPPPPEPDAAPPPPAAPVVRTASRPAVVSAASIPPSQVPKHPVLKQKPDPTSRPLISYSLGEDGVQSETLEGARLSSKPPKK